jgi:hypothetical protein
MKTEYISIFKAYIAKNVLNKFRQDNGYKTGEYIKIWNGQEDNVYVMKFLNEFSGREGLFDFLYSKLVKEYKKVVNGK